MSKGEMDIAKNIKMIENLQCQLLRLVSDLFCSMQDNRATAKDRADLLANIEIMTYLLAERLGISPQALDQKVVARLKVGMLEEEGSDEWKATLLGIYKHMENR